MIRLTTVWNKYIYHASHTTKPHVEISSPSFVHNFTIKYINLNMYIYVANIYKYIYIYVYMYT